MCFTSMCTLDLFESGELEIGYESRSFDMNFSTTLDSSNIRVCADLLVMFVCIVRLAV